MALGSQLISDRPLASDGVFGFGKFELDQINRINQALPPLVPLSNISAHAPVGGEPVFMPRAAPYNPANPLTEMLANFSGFEHRPGAPVAPWRPTPLVVLWAAPQPFGLVPPNWYGIDPNYLPQRWFKDSVYALFGGQALEARELRAAQRQVIESLLSSDTTLLSLTDEELWAVRSRIKELTGYYNVSFASREELVAVLDRINAEDARRAKLPAAAPNPIASQSPSGLTTPLIEEPPPRTGNPVIDRATAPLIEEPPPRTGNPVIDRAIVPGPSTLPPLTGNPIIDAPLGAIR